MASTLWKPLPLYLLVLDELRRIVRLRQATVVKADELFNEVLKIAKQRGFTVSWGEFLKALMVLEIHGYVHTESYGEDNLLIELLRS